MKRTLSTCVSCLAAVALPILSARAANPQPEPLIVHPWCPPFGLDRVGATRAGQAELAFEADAEARPEEVCNPVDLGTILVPSGWLLLPNRGIGLVDVAAISHADDLPGAHVRAWFAGVPARLVEQPLPLRQGVRALTSLRLPPAPDTSDRDVLHIGITGSETRELWHKTIPVMLVREPPKWPRFGATATKLRYDAPISVRDPQTGVLTTLPYEQGWKPELHDVVVSLPSGARFVFWRGASYVPFWAGRNNTCLSYEWAETGPLPEGFVDSVEPLMDKELRYGRVEIVKSTAARVHVRWSYQSTDFHYKVWGDHAVEDFYFYPDGFGTRVLSLLSDPAADYELSEFIILTPQGAYPFAVLPSNLVDVLFLDGEKREFRFPFAESENAAIRKSRDLPAVYRVRLNRHESPAAIYFNPNQRRLPPVIFGPFTDKDVTVTPCYWGSHWPLARGKSTGGEIDDRIQVTPAHNSLMTWARVRPVPLSAATQPAVDTLGRSRTMLLQRWVWLIGMTDASDATLLDWARSFASPPSLELTGARFDLPSYAPERRAIRLVIERPEVVVRIKPAVGCMHPVFELRNAPAKPVRLTLAGRSLGESDYAWDGTTLWLNTRIDVPTELRVQFDPTPTAP